MTYAKPSVEQLGWIREFWNAKESYTYSPSEAKALRMTTAIEELEKSEYPLKGRRMPSLDDLYDQHQIL